MATSRADLILARHRSQPPEADSRLGGHLKATHPFRSFGGDSFDDEYAALGCALSDRLDRLIGWRIVPLTRFLRAVEGDFHDATLRRFALESLDLTPVKNDIVMIERR